MNDPVFILIASFAVVSLVLHFAILFRGTKSESVQRMETNLISLRQQYERIERVMREEIAKNRDEMNTTVRYTREEIASSIGSLSDSLSARVVEIAGLQKAQLDVFSNQLVALTQSTETKLERMRDTLEKNMNRLVEENTEKLEQMRSTVDEKLHATLEQRLGESFRMVSDRLEMVHKGLGEMQSLASGVGDLKKMLSNVKARGTWGEMQLASLLEQMLTPAQYAKNVPTKGGSNDRVEFAIRLPGQDGAQGTEVWLPIDAKFPQEDYLRLIEAQEQANPVLVEEAVRRLEARIKGEARTIREKYLDPPRTTDFAIMFLPIEGLYAEVLRRPGLAELLQRDYRVTVAGPTTLAALLNSLQMGFRTLAIEKRSGEVWSLLGAVKTEFGRFGEILDKTQKKLQEASTTIESAASRSRAIERKLKDVQQLPKAEAVTILGPHRDGEEQRQPDELFS